MMRFASAALIAGMVFAAAPAGAQDEPEPRPPVAVPDTSAPTPPAPVPPAAATPQPPAPGADDARYTFHRVQDGFVRLDSRTGQVSTCGFAAGGWSCQAAADERTALESEIGRLQGDNTALKKELLARGIALPAGVKADPPTVKPPEAPPETNPSVKMPSDAQLDSAMAFIEKVWRRMVEMMANMQREMQRKD